MESSDYGEGGGDRGFLIDVVDMIQAHREDAAAVVEAIGEDV